MSCTSPTSLPRYNKLVINTLCTTTFLKQHPRRPTKWRGKIPAAVKPSRKHTLPDPSIGGVNVFGRFLGYLHAQESRQMRLSLLFTNKPHLLISKSYFKMLFMFLFSCEITIMCCGWGFDLIRGKVLILM